MRYLVAATVVFLTTSHVAQAADRAAELDRLVREYQAANNEFRKIPSTSASTTAEKIHRYEVWPGLQYVPRFLELAEAKPDDEAAFRACQWIIAHVRGSGNEDKRIFPADQKTWEILAAYHSRRPELPLLCFQAIDCYWGPAQERFLRGLLKQQDLSRTERGFATTALAELLAQKCEMIEFYEPFPSHDGFLVFLEHQRSAEYAKDLLPANAPQFKAESIRLFHQVLALYADIPATISSRRFEGFKTLGEKAKTSLHALEHLTIGSQPPALVGKDLEGQPFDLSRYRGRIVMVSFWFTGCPGCMHDVPQHQKLLDVYKGRSFALVSVCIDASLEQAKKTVALKGMNWPCVFDGENGPVAHDWNVLTMPNIFVLDKHGVIAARYLRGERLDQKIAELIDQ